MSDRYSVPCPSCEASVAVKAGSAGKKMECPKCKFRFEVPAQADGGKADDAKGDKAKTTPAAGKKEKGDKKKGKSDAKGKGNMPIVIGVAVGILALAGLGIGAAVVFGNNGNASNNQGKQGQPPAQPPIVPPTNTCAPTGDGPMGDNPMGENPPKTDGPGGTDPMNPANPPIQKDKPKGKLPPRKANGVDITNLLPNDTKALWHVRMDEMSKLEAARSTLFFDKDMRALFAQSMPFEMTDLDEFVQANVGADQYGFAVLRTKSDIDTSKLYSPQMVVPKTDDAVIKNREYMLLKPNPLIMGLENGGFSPTSLLGADIALPTRATAKPVETKYAAHLYDARTLVIAEKGVMERYLNDMDANGFPPFKSDYKELEGAKEVIEGQPMEGEGAAPPAGGAPGAPGAAAGVPPGLGGAPAAPGASAGIPPGLGGPPGGAPGGPPAGAPGGPAAGKPAAKPNYTNNPSFRTIDPDLKRILNTFEEPTKKDQPAATYVTLVDQRVLNLQGLKAMVPDAMAQAFDSLGKVRIIGLAATKILKDRFQVTGYLDYTSDDQANKVMNESILPMLNVLRFVYNARTGDTLAVINGNENGGTSGEGTPGFGPGFGPPPGFGPGSGEGEGTVPPGGSGGSRPKGGRSNAPAPAEDEDVQAAPPPIPPAPGGAGRPPAAGQGPGAGSPGSPFGEGGPGYPGFPGSGNTQQNTKGSKITVSQADTAVILDIDLLWKRDQYDLVRSRFGQIASQLRGRMAMNSGAADPFRLAAVAPDVLKDPKKSLPVGAIDREVTTERPGQYPPDQRCSFFVELLPYLGGERKTLRATIDEKKYPWHHTANRDAAVSWVPELLVPSYPESAWRATSAEAPGVVFGATNYVGLAGLGMDAARMSHTDPANAKKLGMTGYGYGSSKIEVTDGLSNTAYLMQVPPGIPRPWIAGGGATLAGIDEKSEHPEAPYLVKRGDGKRGVTMLMGDGSVRFVREGVNPALFRAMATRAGGETVPDLDKDAPKEKPSLDRDAQLRTSR